MRKLVPVFPWPMHSKVAEVLEAIPGLTLVEALPGGPGPVLAVGKAPSFVCDAIVVSSPEKAAQAVDIVTSNGIRMVTVRDMVSAAFGEDEIPPEVLQPGHAKVSFK